VRSLHPVRQLAAGGSGALASRLVRGLQGCRWSGSYFTTSRFVLMDDQVPPENKWCSHAGPTQLSTQPWHTSARPFSTERCVVNRRSLRKSAQCPCGGQRHKERWQLTGWRASTVDVQCSSAGTVRHATTYCPLLDICFPYLEPDCNHERK
jgi:hypothetical protein